jgi:hypothetical protein
MKTGFLEKAPGEKSMMRLAVLIGVIVGSTVAIWGMVLLTIAVMAVINEVTGASSIIGSLILLIGGALGVIGISEGFKSLQQRSEGAGGQSG